MSMPRHHIQIDQVSHCGSTVGTVPGLVQLRHVTDQFPHIRFGKSRTDHDRRPTRSRGEHGSNPGGSKGVRASVMAVCQHEEYFFDIVLAEDPIPIVGNVCQLKALRRGGNKKFEREKNR